VNVPPSTYTYTFSHNSQDGTPSFSVMGPVNLIMIAFLFSVYYTVPMKCSACDSVFQPKRKCQRYCSPECQNNHGMKRYRHRTSIRKCHNATSPVPRYPNAITKGSSAILDGPKGQETEISYGWGRAGDPPLQGDDFALEYYPDGYPKLPECLRRVKVNPLGHD
jgi:hypothetical protein